ncbi:hypothetical protein [Streptomyces graminilatus]|uniref:hypothetical protein n=1 Tax=Streptomyces graminilatus TaxID=1464070 RepID=UPI0006E176DC|nr:hypothetical protein [Streptomyces graminilatus]
MFETIRWRCHVHANDRRSAERVAGRLADLLDRPAEIESYERYCKFPELAVLQLVSPLGCPTPERALMTVLENAWKIATPWSLGGQGAGPHHEFEGIAAVSVGARFSVPGIERMEFHVTDRP